MAREGAFKRTGVVVDKRIIMKLINKGDKAGKTGFGEGVLSAAEKNRDGIKNPGYCFISVYQK